jgi:hypothetical protein
MHRPFDWMNPPMKRNFGGQQSLGGDATLLIRSRRRSSGGDGRQKLSQSDGKPTRQPRVSPPPAREQTATPGRHRPDPEDSDSDDLLLREGERRA